jgi:hypothetical protein
MTLVILFLSLDLVLWNTKHLVGMEEIFVFLILGGEEPWVTVLSDYPG